MNKAKRILEMFFNENEPFNVTDINNKKSNVKYNIATPTGKDIVRGNIYGYIGVSVNENKDVVFTHLPTGYSIFTVPRMIFEQVLNDNSGKSDLDIFKDILLNKDLDVLEPYANKFNYMLKDTNGEMSKELYPEMKKTIDIINKEFKTKLKKAMDSGKIDMQLVQYYTSGKMIPRL